MQMRGTKLRAGTLALLSSAKKMRKRSTPKGHPNSYFLRGNLASDIKEARKRSKSGARRQYMSDPEMI